MNAPAPSPRPRRARLPRQPLGRLWWRLLALALAAALLAGLLRGADWGRLWTAVRALPAWAWAVAAAGLLASYALRAWRLCSEWRHLGPVALLDGLRLVLLHNAALALLPLRSGEAGYVWLVHRRWGCGPAAAARSLLWLRLQDACVLAALALALLPRWSAAARGVLALSVLGALVLALPALLRAMARMGPRWAVLAEAAAAPRELATGWWCSVLNWLLKLAVIAGLLLALVGGSATAAWRAALGGELAAALPLQAPAGLGSYEAGAWAAAGLAGAAGERLVAAALAVHLFCVAVALVAAALLQAWPAATRRPLESPATQETAAPAAALPR